MRVADDSPPPSAEVNNAWIYTSTTQYIFIAWCSNTWTILKIQLTDASFETFMAVMFKKSRSSWL